MPSPFPGMDPYLEDPSAWEEFHHIFITECMYFLSERLPDSYIAKIDERVELVSRDDEAASQYVPDVTVAGSQRAIGEGGVPVAADRGRGAAVELAPVMIPSADALEVKETYLEILRWPDMKPITSIELLSPWNKFGEGIGEYRHKRRSLVRQGVHVVEIDLLRRGRRTELAQPLPAGDYFAFIFRGDLRPNVNVYAWNLRHPLPDIPIPFSAPDADVALSISALFNTAYDRGNYKRKLRCLLGPTSPPRSPDDMAWALAIEKKFISVGV